MGSISRQDQVLPSDAEPVVPFNFPAQDEFDWTRGFDVVVVAQSPRFTPPSADPLLEVIRGYVDEV